MLRLTVTGPKLLAQHLHGEQPVLVYRVPDLDVAEADLARRGVGFSPRFGFPDGDATELDIPGPQRVAVYQRTPPNGPLGSTAESTSDRNRCVLGGPLPSAGFRTTVALVVLRIGTEATTDHVSRSRASLQEGRPSVPEVVHRTNFVSPISGVSATTSWSWGWARAKSSSAAASRQTDNVAYRLRNGSASIAKPITPLVLSSCRRTAREPRKSFHVERMLLGGMLDASTRYSAPGSRALIVFEALWTRRRPRSTG